MNYAGRTYGTGKAGVEQVLDAAKLERGGLFVVGCSSSEVCGSKIGTNSSLETAQAVFAGIYRAEGTGDLFSGTVLRAS